MDQMPSPDLLHFVQSCFIPRGLKEEFLAAVADSKIECRTQVTIPDHYRIDLTLFANGRPLVAVENKIWSPFQMHSPSKVNLDDLEEGSGEEEVQNAEVRNQLKTYGMWIASQQKGTWPWGDCSFDTWNQSAF